MMPFSVLRTVGIGLLSWALLGSGVYLAYLSYHEFSRPERLMNEESTALESSPGDGEVLAPAAETVPEFNRQRRTADVGPTTEPRSPYRWAYLAAAIVLLGWSFGGSLPTSLMMASASGHPPQPGNPHTSSIVERPDGARLHVDIFGKQSGPTLLLTHGWSLNSSAWTYIRDDLAARYRIVMWDLPGLGRSQAASNKDQSLSKMAEDLEAVRQSTCGDSSVILVGHSIGGMIQQIYAQQLADRLPSQVVGMAFVHTTFTNPIQTNIAAPLTKLAAPLIALLNYLVIALAPLVWLTNWQSYWNGTLQTTSRISSFSGKQTREQLNRGARLAATAWPAVVARGNLAMMRFDGQQGLARFTMPVLIIAGDHDRLTLPSASRRIREIVRHPHYQPVDGGHLGHWEVAGQVAASILGFSEQVFDKAAAI